LTPVRAPEPPVAEPVYPFAVQPSAPPAQQIRQEVWPVVAGERTDVVFDPRDTAPQAPRAPSPTVLASNRAADTVRVAASYPAASPVVPAAYAQPTPAEAPRGRRGPDDFGYQPAAAFPEVPRRTPASSPNKPVYNAGQRTTSSAEPTGPAWLYAPQVPQPPQNPQTNPITQTVAPRTNSSGSIATQSSVADTLQHSRERVAARWFALKGVFEQPGQDQPEVPVRQKETRTPVLAVFSLAGGVGKTSLVATLGRSLSSMGEKVLLTDTTSHGLLPFYFGASELRQGVVRTFSPPSGSTDAPIYLVSYEVDQKINDEAAQSQLIEEIVQNSKGTHRILLDLTPSSGWVARGMARMNPTILVPVAPDMNSVISLQAVEKYFHGTIDSDGRPLQPYYVLNQFDASLPLHLDVREVLRRQLGDRLLPFVIRRAPAVSESLAEGMTVVDYAPDAPVAEDYQNVAAWLRTIAAPATAGFRNVRWSER
jgi:cellulose synthase operon protein YhjQ